MTNKAGYASWQNLSTFEVESLLLSLKLLLTYINTRNTISEPILNFFIE